MVYVAKDPAIRFWPKVDASGDCWEWTGAKSKGYGRFLGGAVIEQAHRWAYESLVGPLDPSVELDHLCRNRGCVNPDHLEPVTRLVNVRRGPRVLRGRCHRGHPLDDATLVVISGSQRCRICKNAVWLDWAKRTGRVAA